VSSNEYKGWNGLTIDGAFSWAGEGVDSEGGNGEGDEGGFHGDFWAMTVTRLEVRRERLRSFEVVFGLLTFWQGGDLGRAETRLMTRGNRSRK